jgi:hypothetical protein
MQVNKTREQLVRQRTPTEKPGCVFGLETSHTTVGLWSRPMAGRPPYPSPRLQPLLDQFRIADPAYAQHLHQQFA